MIQRLARHAPLLAAAATCVLVLAATRSELAIAREPLNDLALHIPLADRLADAMRSGENPLDCWVSEWSLGHPVPRTYQPLAHLLVAGLHVALGGLASLPTVFSVVHWLLIGLLPLSFFAGARLLGLRPGASVAAALLSPLVSTDLLFGIELGSTAWRGSGLFTQSCAQVLLPLALGLGMRRLRGSGRLVPPALLLSLTFSAHFVYGLIGAVSLALAAALPSKARDEIPSAATRLLELAKLGALTFLFSAWLLVPLALDGALVNHSRWESAWKWDAFGLPKVARLLATGELLDFGRFPALTLLALAGLAAILTLLVLRRSSDAERFVLAGSALWLLLLGGRPAWDGAWDLLGLGDVPLHRLIGGAHLFLILLAAIGLSGLASLPATLGLARRLPRHGRVAALIAGGLLAGLALAPALAERARFIATGEEWGRETIALTDLERADLDAAVALCKERGGRAFSGSAGGWGKDFGVKWTPFHAFLSRERVPQVSFLFHAMALTSDIMVRFDEGNPAHWRLFDVRTGVAPPEHEYGGFVTEIARFGRFGVFEAPGVGSFDVVDVAAAVRCDRRSFYDVVEPWMSSEGPDHRRHLALDLEGRFPEPGFISQPVDTRLPPGDPVAPGSVLSEWREGERRGARVRIDAPHAWLLLKMTWHPQWRASVNGEPAPTSHLTPGFVAVKLPSGEHEVAFEWDPGHLKTILLLVAVAGLGAGLAWERRAGETWKSRASKIQLRLTERLHALALRLAFSRRVREAAGVTALALLAGMPLLLQGLSTGHDSVAYMPRIVEAHENFRHGILLPRWAPNLSEGHGQPFFLFTPPLPGWLWGIPHALGASPERSIGLGMFIVLLLGLLAMRRAAAEVATERASWVAATAFALAPYVATDLHVRTAFAEATALLLAPVALLGLLRHRRTRSPRDLSLAACGVAAVGLSHHASALMLVPLLLALCLLQGRLLRSVAVAASQAGAVALGVIVAACAWLPGLLEADLVKLHEATTDYFHWSMHLVEPWQLLWSRWGFGLSLEGSGDGMSFRLGPLHLLLAATAGACAVDASRRRREEGGEGQADEVTMSRSAFALIAFLLPATLAAALLMTTWASLAWRVLPLLPSVQFPWRLSGVVTLMLALLAALATDALVLRAPPRLGRLIPALLVVAFVVFGYPLARPGGRTFPDPLAWMPEEIARRAAVATSMEEFEPLGVVERGEWMPGLVAQADAGAGVEAERVSPERIRLLVPAASEGEVILRLHDFAGWRLEGDIGGIVHEQPEPRTSRLRLRVMPSPGDREAWLVLGRTRTQRVGILLSFIGICGVAGLLVFRRRPEREDEESG